MTAPTGIPAHDATAPAASSGFCSSAGRRRRQAQRQPELKSVQRIPELPETACDAERCDEDALERGRRVAAPQIGDRSLGNCPPCTEQGDPVAHELREMEVLRRDEDAR